MYCSSNQLDWDQSLPYICWAYNTTRHVSSKFSPYYLLYGREPRLVLDSVLNHPIQSDSVQDIIDRMEESRDIAKDFIIDSQLRNKTFYDDKRRDSPFKVNDKVMVFTPIKKKGLSEKLLHKYFGAVYHQKGGLSRHCTG